MRDHSKKDRETFSWRKFGIVILFYFAYLYAGALVLMYLEEGLDLIVAVYCCHCLCLATSWGTLTHTKNKIETKIFILVYIIVGMPLLWMFATISLNGLARLIALVRKQIHLESGLSFWILVIVYALYIVLGAYVLMLLSDYENWTYRQALYYAFYEPLSIGYLHVTPPMNMNLMVFMMYNMLAFVQIIDILQHYHLKLLNFINNLCGVTGNEG